ncbi:hypothetical protein LguiA_005190 [Lonicera macranthoides]
MESVVGDTSNPTPDIETPRSTSRSRVETGSSAIGRSPKRLKFNENGLPIGDKAPSATRLGKLARTHIPICYKTWKLVPERYMDTLWSTFKKEFPEVKDSQRGIFLGKANEAWKKFKSRLRANFVGNDVSKWKEKVPTLVKSEDWEIFCDHEATENQKQIRIQNKANKVNGEPKGTHNTGRDGYARSAEKWEEVNGRPPSRAELWLATHSLKDGTYAPYNKKFADQIEFLLKVFKERGEKETLDSGPINEVFGKDSRGRVRCVGSHVSRKAMLNSSFAREMLAEVKSKRDCCEEKVDKLAEEVDGLKGRFKQFIDEFRDGKFVSTATPNVRKSTYTDEAHTNENPLTAPPPTSLATPSQVGDEGINCKILSYKREIVGYGRKSNFGAVTNVHDHILELREVKVVVDKILIPNHSLWGGQQGCATTLEDIGRGGIMYWHDDFFPPTDD